MASDNFWFAFYRAEIYIFPMNSIGKLRLFAQICVALTESNRMFNFNEFVEWDSNLHNAINNN